LAPTKLQHSHRVALDDACLTALTALHREVRGDERQIGSRMHALRRRRTCMHALAVIVSPHRAWLSDSWAAHDVGRFDPYALCAIG